MQPKKPNRIMPELVPAPLWGRSASKMLRGRAAWKVIRQDALSQAQECCSICGSGEGQLSCHDKWQYDDKKCTATLAGFEVHCANCDSVVHAGRAIKLGYGEIVVSHLAAINGWNAKRAIEVLQEAMDVWRNRSAKDWSIVVAPALLKRYPALTALPSFVPPSSSVP
jgi:hypothetical protein